MRLCLLILCALFVCSGLSRGQSRPRPKPTPAAQPTPTPTATPEKNTANEPKEPAKDATKDEEAEETSIMLRIITAQLVAETCAGERILGRTESDACKANPAQQLADLHAQAVKHPRLVMLLSSAAFRRFTNLSVGARGAAQVSQAADEASIKFQMIIVAQNQRIIELLEQLLKKK